MQLNQGNCLRRAGVVFAVLLGCLAFIARESVKADPPSKSDSPPPAQTPDPSAGARSLNDAEVIAFINEQIEKAWKENGIKPSKVATDYEFTRRVFLDIIGRIPTANPDPTAPKDKKYEPQRVGEAQYYLERSHKVSRAEIVENLVKHEDYVFNWADIWTVWLLTRHSPPGVDRDTMRLWLEDFLATEKGYNKMVEEILTASGKANELKSGAVNFLLSHVGEIVPADKRDRDGEFEMVPATSRTAKLFLGIHLQCTQCHIHPFIDGRKQHDYWGMNAFYRQVERQPANIMLRRQDSKDQFYTLKDNLSANVDGGIFFEQRAGTLVRTAPIYLDGTRLTVSPTMNRRQELAKLVTHDPRFARAIVNRMWHHFFGRGFTKVVDELEDKENDPVSHPELLDYLANAFVKSGYDLRRLTKWICLSKPYQLTSVANETNKGRDKEMYFSRMLLKAMTPEQLVKSVFIATNARQSMESSTRRKMQDEWLKEFSLNFGDDEGNEATFNGTVVQALMLMNGKRINEAIQGKTDSTLHHAFASGSFEGRLKYIYLATLTRPPTGGEEAVAHNVAAKYPSTHPVALWQDVMWALLNSNEFFLNH
jgi:hypothetical protein